MRLGRRRSRLARVCAAAAIAGASFLLPHAPGSVLVRGQEPAPPQRPVEPQPSTDAEIERFLRTARVVRVKGAGKGVTNSIRATLSDGTLTHDAHIQTIDEYRQEFRTLSGVEFNFRDSWSFNIAAYKLDRLLGLDLVPVSVPGTYRSQPAAITWWVDDVMMDEGMRLKKKAPPPAEKALLWHHQIAMMRIFDQLIYNTDRNAGNMLITHGWRLWAIDHTRAFRRFTTLKSPDHVKRCDREVYERLKGLTLDVLARELGRYIDEGQIKAMLARRDLIVALLQSLGANALFDRRESS